MRKLALSLIVAFAFYVTAAAAQAGGGMGSSSQGTQGSSPTTQQQPGATQPGMGQPGTAGQSPDMGPGANGTSQNGTIQAMRKRSAGTLRCCHAQAIAGPSTSEPGQNVAATSSR